MWNKIKRWNRGGILAIIAFFCVTGFIIVDEVTFKRQADNLRESADNFAASMKAAAMTPDPDEMTQKYKDAVNEFMVHQKNDVNKETSANLTGYWMYDKSELTRWGDFSRIPGTITNYKYDFKKVTVRKTGPGMGSVEVSYELEFDLTIPYEMFKYADADNDEYKYDIYREYGDNYRIHFEFPGVNGREYTVQSVTKPQIKQDTVINVKGEGTAQYNVRRVNGEWRFDGMGGHFYGDYSDWDYPDYIDKPETNDIETDEPDTDNTDELDTDNTDDTDETNQPDTNANGGAL
ncbi:MAG: hypothetical protein FWG45_07410 [Oscillospiraceae bacterium]|nr:hypothetical protein [Oscillospiraceae bacterium]